MAQNEEQIVVEEELTSYTLGVRCPAAAKAARPALTVAGAAVGRRKEAVARVRVVPGSGNWTINGRSLEDYFPNKLHQQDVNQPFKLLELEGCIRRHRTHQRWWPLRSGRCSAPGYRSCTERDRPREQPPRTEEAGYLTRDARVIERKKAGLKKARKASQFSKR